MTTSPSAVDEDLLAALERAFAEHAGADGRIDLKELQKALGVSSEYLARRVMVCFDANADGAIGRDEFLAGARALLRGTDREKLHFAFRLHDHDGDGFIDRQELLRMISVTMAESAVIERVTQPAEQLANMMFATADVNRDGRISFEELEAVVRKRPELLRRMTRNEAIWLAPNEDLLADVEARRKRPGKVARFFENHWPAALLGALWIGVHVAIFAIGMREAAAETKNAAMELGRALGTCIDFDGALILVPMMRRLLSWVRSTWLGRVVPLDDSITFHRVVGHTLFALAVAHAAAFVVGYHAGHASLPLARVLLTSHGITGGLLIVVFAVMWAFSFSFIRRTKHFELFYFTHLLYVAWFVLAVVHAPTFLLFAGVPILGFAVEQLLRLRRRGVASTVLSSQALRSGVTRLAIAKPVGFRYGPGDYVFLRIPAIARHEWHPFTISRAPEHDDLSFHVRALGNWTTEVRRHVEGEKGAEGLPVFIDGPYGSPSAHIFESRYAVLIGAGIGVTPFASVLESMVLRANGESDRPSQLKKAYFFWLNRDQYSFEWFAALLSQLEAIDHKGMLEIHLCMTRARAGATALGLEVAREIMHAAGRSDIITGLRTKTHVGPPDWEGMLRFIAEVHRPEQVDVFFCGPPGLAAKLRPLCKRLGMGFREERF